MKAVIETIWPVNESLGFLNKQGTWTLTPHKYLLVRDWADKEMAESIVEESLWGLLLITEKGRTGMLQCTVSKRCRRDSHLSSRHSGATATQQIQLSRT